MGNLAFLQSYWPDFAKTMDYAEKYVYIDPASSIVGTTGDKWESLNSFTLPLGNEKKLKPILPPFSFIVI